uniref:Reductase n=1 Tax=Dulem virus 39 TaxID=3145757 RepID=A0AAU8B5E7_9CAUD
MQSLPLQSKIQMTRYRIRQWVNEFGEDGVYVSFSGGKDSTVLLDIVRKDYPNIEAVFVNTGLEYPSVSRFATSKDNVTVLRPTMNFRDVICKYGYPVIGKQVACCVDSFRKGKNWAILSFAGLHNQTREPDKYIMDRYGVWKFLAKAPFLISSRCCDEMKEKPIKKLKRKGITGLLAEESTRRTKAWLQTGCNSFSTGISKPMSFWTENDVLQYIHENNLLIAEAYGDVIVKGTENGQMCIAELLDDYRDCQYVTTGCKRTGCIFCMFGITQDKDRFIRLAEQEPKLCDYVMRGGEFNEQGMWQPSKSGLGYWFVIEWLNVYGNLKIGMPDREKYLSEYQTEETRKYLDCGVEGK